MFDIAAYGFVLSGLFFLVLSLLLFINWERKLQGGFLIFASFASASWSATMAWQLFNHDIFSETLWILESIRTLGWLAFLAYVLLEIFNRNQSRKTWLVVLIVVFTLLSIALMTPFETWLVYSGLDSRFDFLLDFRLSGNLVLSIIGISLVEQLFVNSTPESRWSIKFLCLGLGLGFAYDFYLYADSLLFKRIDPLLWESRGAINSLIAPMVAVSVRRNTDWSLNVFVSKQVVFHTTGLVGAGLYLLLMSLIGYYIRDHGGEYGDFFRLVFFVAAIALLFVLVSSGQLRARLKVFLNKNFFKYQYDYRDEWVNLINNLAKAEHDVSLPERVLQVMSGMLDCPGGSLWLCDRNTGTCRQAASKNNHMAELEKDLDWQQLVEFLNRTHWVIDLDEYQYNQPLYGDLIIPDSILNDPDSWLIVPLFHNDMLFGILWLSHSNSIQKLNWENRDLLMMAGLQASSYLALEKTARELSEARQFEGFNRLSAFVIHDLKNLIAQLSLVASNAERHKHNPAFIEDALTTIENSVGKMNRLMLQLKSAGSSEKMKLVDIKAILEDVVEAKSRQMPVPVLHCLLDEGVLLRAEPERLGAVIGHVVQNAQDATPDDGTVDIELTADERSVVIIIKDTGTGMDEQFVKERLFKPFDTTKGLTGMGIGAYESKEFIESMGGALDVFSKENLGTTFILKIPRNLD